MPELQPVFEAFPDVNLISISNDQRKGLPKARYLGTVYHGIPAGLLVAQPGVEPKYLAFLGRIMCAADAR